MQAILLLGLTASLGLSELLSNPFLSREQACFVSFQRNGQELGFLQGGIHGGQGMILSDAWILDFDSNIWFPVLAPLPPRYDHTCLFNESAQSVVLLGGTEYWGQSDSSASIILRLDDLSVISVDPMDTYNNLVYNYFQMQSHVLSVAFYRYPLWFLQHSLLNGTNLRMYNQTNLPLNVNWTFAPEDGVALGDRIFFYGGLFPDFDLGYRYNILGEFIVFDTVHGNVSQVSDTNRPYITSFALTPLPSQSGRAHSFLLSGGCFNLSGIPAVCTHANTDVYRFDEDDMTWKVVASNVHPVPNNHPAFYHRDQLYIVGKDGTQIINFGSSPLSSTFERSIPSSPLALILGCIFGSAILAISIALIVLIALKRRHLKPRVHEDIPLL